MSLFQILLFPYSRQSSPTPPGGNFLALENGSYLLQENGFRFELEQ